MVTSLNGLLREGRKRGAFSSAARQAASARAETSPGCSPQAGSVSRVNRSGERAFGYSLPCLLGDKRQVPLLPLKERHLGSRPPQSFQIGDIEFSLNKRNHMHMSDRCMVVVFRGDKLDFLF